MYNPSPELGDDEYFEYVEIYNNGIEQVDLSGWYFSEGFLYIFPDGVILDINEYIVVCQNPDSISINYGISNVVGPFVNGALSNSGEDIELSDADDFVVDYVAYDSSGEWPSEPDGNGPSLELIDPGLDNLLPGSWAASTINNGTPGIINSVLTSESITVVSPNGGEFWEQGTMKGIIWTSLNYNVPVRIEIIDSGMEILVDSTDNDGFWLWEIPADFTPGSNYLIVISERETGMPSDTSDAPFSIIEPVIIPDILITEIMYDPPETGIDSLEFIELYNKGETSVNLDGYYLSSGINYVFPSLTIESGEFIVLAKDSLAMENTFNYSAYEWYDGDLNDTTDLIELRNPYHFLVDSVLYENNLPWPPEAGGTGPSLTFCDPDLDNSLAENWLVSIELAAINQEGDSIFATPGTLCFSPIENIVITEIMYHPPGNPDDSLEFLEIFNLDIDTVFLGGCHFSQGIDFSFPDISIAPGDFIVISQNFDSFLNIYGYPSYEWLSGDLNNEGDTIILRDGLNNIIDQVIFSSQMPWDTLTAGYGSSLSLCDPTSNNSIAENWLASTEFAGQTLSGDTLWATPYTGCDIVFNDIVITEIMYNPPCIDSDSLEFIEIFNNGVDTINLKGFYFSEAIDFIFTDVEINPDQYILVCNDSIAMYSTFMKSAYEWESGHLLDDLGELIELRDTLDQIVDHVFYQGILPWDTLANGHGPSLVLCNPFQDNTLPSSWNASVSPYTLNASGDTIYATPGNWCGEVPPIVDFASSENIILSGDSINFFDLSTGSPEEWYWTFDGGTPSLSGNENPEAIFYFNAGIYSVSLVVVNAFGEDAIIKQDYITVMESGPPPVAEFTASDTIIAVGTLIDFTDLSLNVPTSWLWVFEGAETDTSYVQNPENILYDQAGSFSVKLEVGNSFGFDNEIKENYIVVGYPPECDFLASDTAIAMGSKVIFTDISTGDPDLDNSC